MTIQECLFDITTNYCFLTNSSMISININISKDDFISWLKKKGYVSQKFRSKEYTTWELISQKVLEYKKKGKARGFYVSKLLNDSGIPNNSEKYHDAEINMAVILLYCSENGTNPLEELLLSWVHYVRPYRSQSNIEIFSDKVNRFIKALKDPNSHTRQYNLYEMSINLKGIADVLHALLASNADSENVKEACMFAISNMRDMSESLLLAES